ncbi:ABC transporter ATP-binding protein [Primorskyibacter sp. 2E107]|uniref:ABC transporter ATP-binding protein n=1 Tax=Primorskyibacter sp. 2E107 TaxID=3403458 RepID=UPI003AF46CD1
MKPTEWINPFAEADGPPPRTLMRFCLWAIRGAWPPLMLAAAFSVLGGVVEVASAIILGWVVDGALSGGAETVFSANLGLLIFSLFFFLALRPVLFGVNAYLQTQVTQPNVFSLILSRVHRYTIGQSVSFFDNDFAGRISQKEMQTARALNDVITEMLHTVLFAIASVVGAVLMVGTVNWRIAGGLIIWMGAYWLLIRHFMPRVRARSKARAAARAMITGQMVDTVTNIKTVKLFAHAEYEDQAALGAMDTYRNRFIEFGRVSVEFRFWLMALAGLLPVMMVGGALWYWSLGLVSAGDIAATGAVSLRLAQMTGWVSFALMGLYANIGEVEDGMRTLTPSHDLVDVAGAKALSVDAGRIEFRDVGFSYGRESGGVEQINLHIEPGEKLGVVGASGAGKSTLVSILMRLYDVEKGVVLIDGQDIAAVTQDSLRQQIGMVTQETAMFNRSAMDNIRYGRPDATEEEVFEAARRAEAHEFILGLRDHAGREGYGAHLGERGVKLSGGQRQRIALARAILKDAPILVLDEATSALDSEVEASIQDALDRVMQGKTVLAIAHRLSTISSMDRIIVLDGGHIVEEGGHTDLLAKGGLYARYWERQSGGFLGSDEGQEAAE